MDTSLSAPGTGDGDTSSISDDTGSELPAGARVRAPAATAPPVVDLPVQATPGALADEPEPQADGGADDDAMIRGNREQRLKVLATVVPAKLLPVPFGKVGIALESLSRDVRAVLKEQGVFELHDSITYDRAQVVMEHDFRDFETNALIYHAEGFLFQVRADDTLEFALELTMGEKQKPIARDMRPEGWLASDADAR